jgi:hypothetical protein
LVTAPSRQNQCLQPVMPAAPLYPWGPLARNSDTIVATNGGFVKQLVGVLRARVEVASGRRVVAGIIMMCCGRSEEARSGGPRMMPRERGNAAARIRWAKRECLPRRQGERRQGERRQEARWSLPARPTSRRLAPAHRSLRDRGSGATRCGRKIRFIQVGATQGS